MAEQRPPVKPRGPQLLPVAAVTAGATGWALIRGGSQRLPVAQYPPSPAAADRCWWTAEPPPGNGLWPERDSR